MFFKLKCLFLNWFFIKNISAPGKEFPIANFANQTLFTILLKFSRVGRFRHRRSWIGRLRALWSFWENRLESVIVSFFIVIFLEEVFADEWSVLVHADFASSGATKITVFGFTTCYCFLARHTILRNHFGTNWTGQLKYFVIDGKIILILANFNFILDIFDNRFAQKFSHIIRWLNIGVPIILIHRFVNALALLWFLRVVLNNKK